MATTVYRTKIETGEEIVTVPSFTEDDEYRVHKRSGACSCPRGRAKKDVHKHVRLARSGVPLDNAERGMLADGTRVLSLAHVAHAYPCRVWGFEQGLWEHVLCFDGERFLVESTRLLTSETRVREIADWRRWRDHLPAHASRAEVA